MSSRVGKVLTLSILALAGLSAGRAFAAAEIHRFSIVLNAIPTNVALGDYNSGLDSYNNAQLAPKGYEGLKHITFSWLFDARGQYFVRPNMAVVVGVGQMRAVTHQQFLPALSSSVDIRSEILSVPVTVGGLYYLSPYNSGDFQARMYIGGGLLDHVYNRARFQVDSENAFDVNGNPTFPPYAYSQWGQEAPGYYFELGGHMFFASRFSVLLGGIYRSATVKHLIDPQTQQPVPPPSDPLHQTMQISELDLTGLGFKMGLGIGF